MATVDTQAEEARIRTILEINSFDLATLENYLVSNAYIPTSGDEEAIRGAMYRLHECYLDEAPQFTRNPRLEDLFNPYPYGDAPVDDALGNTRTAREAHKHERESAKYNAVKDLIQVIATRNIQTAKPAEEDLQAEQGKTRAAEDNLKLEKEKTDLLEKQVKSLQKKYEAVKLLVDESYDSELERIDNANNIRGPRRPSGFRAREKAATAVVKEETPRTPPPVSTRSAARELPVGGRQDATATASEITQAVPSVDIPSEPTGPLLDEDHATIPRRILQGKRKVRGKRKRSKKEMAVASTAEESSEPVAATTAPVQQVTCARGRPKGSGAIEKIR